MIRKIASAAAALFIAASIAIGAQALSADRVQETTTTTGTGTVTLAGAVDGFRTFASAFSTGNLIQYAIVSASGTEWEVGNGTLATTSTITRDTIVASSNSGSAVNFSAGTKKVFATLNGTHANSTVLGPASATDECFARFNLATGKLVQDSVVCATDAGIVSGATQLNVDNLRLDGNTISSTNTNGNIVLAPNGTGQVAFPAGSSSLPGLTINGDPDTGFYQTGANGWGWSTSGFQKLQIDGNALYLMNGFLLSAGNGDGSITSLSYVVSSSTGTSGAPEVLQNNDSLKFSNNTGVTAKNYLQLTTTKVGVVLPFCNLDGDGMRIVAVAPATIRRVASVTTSGGYIETTTIGACVSLVRMSSTEWLVYSTNDVGTDSWTFN